MSIVRMSRSTGGGVGCLDVSLYLQLPKGPSRGDPPVLAWQYTSKSLQPSLLSLCEQIEAHG